MRWLRFIWPAIIGFLSIYLFWLIPSYVFQADYSGAAYKFGDHIILPLFNAVAVSFLVNKTKWKVPRVSRMILLCFVILASLGALQVIFEPAINKVLAGHLTFRPIDIYHEIFIWLEFGFFIWICLAFPLIWPNRKNLGWFTALCLLMASFLTVAFMVDADQNDISFFKKSATAVTFFVGFSFIFIWQFNFARDFLRKRIKEL